MVMMKGGQSMTFMVDTGAEHFMVTTPVAPLTGQRVTLVGATGDMTAHSFCKAHLCQLGGHLVTHEFLYLLECPIPLLSRDLLTMLGAQITFAPRKPASVTLGSQLALVMALTMPREDEWCLYSSGREQINLPRLLKAFPDVWTEKVPPGLAKNQVCIVVDLRPGDTPVRNNIQYHGRHAWEFGATSSTYEKLRLNVSLSGTLHSYQSKSLEGMTTLSRTSTPSTVQ